MYFLASQNDLGVGMKKIFIYYCTHARRPRMISPPKILLLSNYIRNGGMYVNLTGFPTITYDMYPYKVTPYVRLHIPEGA